MSNLNRLGFTYDANLQMKDAGLVATSGIAQINGANRIIDVGDSVFFGWLVIDWTACEIGSTDELYTVIVQGTSRSATSTPTIPSSGTTIENLAQEDFGAAAVRRGGAGASPSSGRFEMPFRNVFNGTTLPLLRVYTTVAGSIATGFNYTAFIGKGAY